MASRQMLNNRMLVVGSTAKRHSHSRVTISTPTGSSAKTTSDRQSTAHYSSTTTTTTLKPKTSPQQTWKASSAPSQQSKPSYQHQTSQPTPSSFTSSTSSANSKSQVNPTGFISNTRKDLSAFPANGNFQNEESVTTTKPSNATSTPTETTTSTSQWTTESSNQNGENVQTHSQTMDSASFPRTVEDLSTSYRGASAEPFPREVIDILLQEIPPKDIEIKPDGMIYLPEIKYRRILNRAFGPGGWGLVPRGPHTIGTKTISREYALFCLGRFVSQARGEQDYFGEDGLPTASEGCKSNALMRCCKDLGIASELWDPAYIREFKKEHCTQVWGINNAGNRKLLWRRKDRTL
ncbi:hypothetical protein HDU76_000951, partial [Blyttiomyces sp. JEL0837]